MAAPTLAGPWDKYDHVEPMTDGLMVVNPHCDVVSVKTICMDGLVYYFIKDGHGVSVTPKFILIGPHKDHLVIERCSGGVDTSKLKPRH